VQQSQCRGSNETDAARLSHGPPSRGISAFRPSKSPRGISSLHPDGASALGDGVEIDGHLGG
jgi:hypothetical protein